MEPPILSLMFFCTCCFYTACNKKSTEPSDGYRIEVAHVAFGEPGIHAPECRRITLDYPIILIY